MRWLCLILAGCSSGAAAQYEPDAAPRDLEAGKAVDAGVNMPSPIPPREYFVNAASALTNATDIRLCASPTATHALPLEQLVPRTNYPGIPAGGFAELVPTTFASPFVLDAYATALLEKNGTQGCDALASLGQQNPIPAPSAAPQARRAIVLVGGDGSPLSLLTFEVVREAPRETHVQSGLAARWLEDDYDLDDVSVEIAREGGSCSSPGAPLAVGTSSAPAPLAEPPSPEGYSVKVCAKKKQGATKELVLEEPLLDVERRSAPAISPSAFFQRAPLFLLLFVGDKTPNIPARKLHSLLIPFPVTR